MTSGIQSLPQGDSQNCNKETVKAGTKQDNLSPDSDLVNNQGNSLIERKIKFAKGFKIAAFAAGGTAAVTGVLAIVGAALATLTTITFLSHAAILGLGITAIALLITTIGLAIASSKNIEDAKALQQLNKVDDTKNNADDVKNDKNVSIASESQTNSENQQSHKADNNSTQPKEPLPSDLDTDSLAKNSMNVVDFLRECQGLVVETAKIGTELGRGNYGAVFEATANFLEKAIQVVKKGFFHPIMGTNELYVQYRILQYITEHYDELSKDPFWVQSVDRLALIILSNEQKQILSQIKTPEELMNKINSMANDVLSRMEAAIESAHDYNQRQEFKDNFPKEVDNGFFLQFKPGKSLENDPDYIIKTCSVGNRDKAFQDILSGACLLDQVGIIHRDIRGANIQVDISTDNIPKASLLDLGIGLDTQNLGIYDRNKEQRSFKSLKSLHCSPPEAFSDDLTKDPENEKIIFNPKTYNAYGVGTVLPSMYYGKSGQDMIDSYFLKFEKYAQHLSDDLANSAKQIVRQLPDKRKEFGKNFKEHVKKLSDVVHRNPVHLLEDYLNQICLQFKQLPPEQATKILEAAKKCAEFNDLDEDVKENLERLAESSFKDFKEKFFSYFPADVNPSDLLSIASERYLERRFLSASDVFHSLPNLIEKNPINTEFVMNIYTNYNRYFGTFSSIFGNLHADLVQSLEEAIENDKKDLAKPFNEKDKNEKDKKISEFNELLSDALLFYKSSQNALQGNLWNLNGDDYNKAKVWSRKQYIIECEKNFKKLNEELQSKGIQAYSPEEVQKQVEIEKALMSFDPKDRKSCADVLKDFFGIESQTNLE